MTYNETYSYSDSYSHKEHLTISGGGDKEYKTVNKEEEIKRI